jgi:hypothetical protein
MNADIESRVREMMGKGNPWGAVTLLLEELKRLRALLAAKEQGAK